MHHFLLFTIPTTFHILLAFSESKAVNQACQQFRQEPSDKGQVALRSDYSTVTELTKTRWPPIRSGRFTGPAASLWLNL